MRISLDVCLLLGRAGGQLYVLIDGVGWSFGNDLNCRAAFKKGSVSVADEGGGQLAESG